VKEINKINCWLLAALVAVKDERWRRFASSARWFSVGSMLVGAGLIFVFMAKSARLS